MGGCRHRCLLAVLAGGLAAASIGACGSTSAHLKTHPGTTGFIHSEVEGPPARTYVPSARHVIRPRHAVYGDEVGENIVGTPYGRIVTLFGPPLKARRSVAGPCLYYRVVGSRLGWEFCFLHGRMDSAAGITERTFLAER